MRAKIKFYLVLFGSLSFCSLVANAQEGNPLSTEIQELSRHRELNLNDDKTLLMDADLRPAKTQSNFRDTNAAAVNTKPKTENQNKPATTEKKDEDPLSFNFLYFIIEKFKVSDIVED